MSGNQHFADFFYPSPDGLKLHARIYGETIADRRPVVCLPGLTRNARDFHDLALYLSGHAKNRRQVVAFDYRGRGRSAHAESTGTYNVITETADVLAGLDALGIAEAAFIGTSRGGLIIHMLGTMRPAILTAIVLNDVGPVLETAGLAHIRSYLNRTPGPKTFAETVEAQRAAHGADFPSLKVDDWERMARALYREENGLFVPDFDPKLVDTVTDLDLSKPLPALWPQFEALAGLPMLAIRGANSRLLSAGTLEEMHKRHPGLETITVEGQGHAPFLEKGGLPDTIAGFLDRTERA